MSSSKDGPGKSDPKNDPKAGGKTDSGSLDPKKPTPIIDLKATEVKGNPATDAKTDTKTGGKPASPVKGAAAGSAGSSGGGTSVASGASKGGTSVPSSGADPMKASTTGQTAKPETKPAAGDETKPAAGKSDSDKPGADEPPKPAKAESSTSGKGRSGGGVWSTFTHLAAGVAGGALVLFGAQPIEQNVGMELLPRAEVPAELNQRLAALESRPAASANSEMTELAEQVRANDARLVSLAGLRQRLEELAAAQKASPAAAQSSSGPASEPEEIADLQQRLAKLEKTFETLSSATTAGGEKTDGARLAALTGTITDIETSLNNQISALRESVSKELETRVAKTAEASAAAKAGTQRLDRELATVKTDAARLTQRAETIKAAQDSLTQSVRVAREEVAKLNVQLDTLKNDVLQQFKSFTRPQDVASALQPLTTKLSSLESQLGKVVESETARKTNAKRIVMALELGNLKRVLNRGGPYASELAEVKRVTGPSVDFSALEKFKSDGVPTSAQLRQEFSKLAYDIIRADRTKEGATTFERLLGSAKSLVRVRRADLPANDTSTEATVARIDKQLKQGNLAGALEEAKKLPEKSALPARSWLERVAARANIDRAVTAIETQLKTSLGSSAATKG